MFTETENPIDVHESLLLDEETKLYNQTVFDVFIRRANAPGLLPASLVVFHLPNGAEEQRIHAFAGVLHDLAQDNQMLARVSSEVLVAVLSHTTQNSAYLFLEQLAGRMERLGLLERIPVEIVVRSWSSPIQKPEELLQDAYRDLKNGRRLKLQFIAQSERRN